LGRGKSGIREGDIEGKKQVLIEKEGMKKSIKTAKDCFHCNT
jgi:hypothetical protein